MADDRRESKVWKELQSPKPLPKPKFDEWACPICGGLNKTGSPKCQWCGNKPKGKYANFATNSNVNLGINAEIPEWFRKTYDTGKIQPLAKLFLLPNLLQVLRLQQM